MKSPDRPWQAVEYGILSRMAKVGKTDEQIAGILGRTERDVWKIRKALGASISSEKPPVRAIDEPLPQVGGLALKKYTAAGLLAEERVTPNCSWEAKARASTAFLIALLRAGHKPGQGEFKISSEARYMRSSQLAGA